MLSLEKLGSAKAYGFHIDQHRLSQRRPSKPFRTSIFSYFFPNKYCMLKYHNLGQSFLIGFTSSFKIQFFFLFLGGSIVPTLLIRFVFFGSVMFKLLFIGYWD